MGEVERRAYIRYRQLKRRCEQKTHICFKNYGLKGIKVIISPREFIGWFVEEAKNFDSLRMVDVGRIDHSKNYELGNILLQTRKENVLEKIKRVGNGRKPPFAVVVRSLDDSPVKIFKDLNAACVALGINYETARKSMNAQRPLKKYKLKISKF
jgi:hypothetical protein